MSATARAFVLTARAKFNVRLEVGGVRPDGLHDVRSVVADLAVGDEVAFLPSGGGFSVTCDNPAIPHAANLAWRAAKALGVELPSILVQVKKSLPLEAGLGGGSSDAAAVLRGLAILLSESGVTLSREALLDAAAHVGSDVAACLTLGMKVVESRGDVVRPLQAEVPPFGILLLKPVGGVPTAAAYRLLDAARSAGADRPAPRGPAVAQLCDALARGDFGKTCSLVHNDFQRVIEADFPDVAKARLRLNSAGAAATVLCGSGSCVAGLFANVAQARSALGSLKPVRGEWAAATGFAHDR